MNKLVLIALTLTLSPLVAAEQYIQVQASSVKNDSASDACDVAKAVAATSSSLSSSCDDSGTGYRLSYGYVFNDMFSIEGGFQDLGRADAWAGNSPSNYIEFATDTKAYDITGVARWKMFDDLSFHARLGVMRWEQDFTYEADGETEYKSSDSGMSLLYGVGIEYLMFSLSYELANDVGDDEVEGLDIGGDVERISLGAKLRF